MSNETVTSPTAKIAGVGRAHGGIRRNAARRALHTGGGKIQALQRRTASGGDQNSVHLDLALHIVLYEVEHLLAVALLYSVEPGGTANVHAVFLAGIPSSAVPTASSSLLRMQATPLQEGDVCAETRIELPQF